MLDISYIRENRDRVAAAVRDKGAAMDLDELLALDERRRTLQSTVDEIEHTRNQLAQQSRTGAVNQEEGRRLKEQLKVQAAELDLVSQKYRELLEEVPNIPTEDTPVGHDESANVVLKTYGQPPEFPFTPLEHWQLGTRLGIFDADTAARVAGSRFIYLKGELVWLQFALVHLALSVLTDRKTLSEIIRRHELSVPDEPFVPVLPPVLIRPPVLNQMARLKPTDERYYLPQDELYLVGSAEHTLGPLHLRETLLEANLPRRYVGYSTCFRREAGSHGKDVHGMLRVHQFDKLEIESFTVSEQARAEQNFNVALQEELMQRLQLPYRTVLVCTGEMGTPDARQIDLEAWLPGQHRWRETHTADLTGDYQARRLRTKVKRKTGAIEFAHMNDATVFAIGRTLIAIMENYQQADGSVLVPEALRPYVNFEKIGPPVQRASPP